MVTQAPKDLSAEDVERMLVADDAKLAEGQVLHSEHGGGFTATVTTLKDPDLDVVYNQRTGVASWFKVYEGNNSRMKMLAKRYPDGERINGSQPPENPPDAVIPDTFCIFQEQHSRYDEMKAMGFRRCARPGPLVGELGAEMHAKHAHPDQLAMVKDHDARRRENDALLLQQQQGAAMLKLADSVSARDSVEAPAESAPVAAKSELCDICDERFANLAVHKNLKTDDAHKAARGE